MPITRLILAVLLTTAPLLGAQQLQLETREGGTAKTAVKTAPAQSSAHTKTARQSEHESFQITILFKRYRDEKRLADMSYTLLATTGEVMPAMRDDQRHRASLSDDKEFLDRNIDVDILGLRRYGDSIYVALRISTQAFSLDDSIFSPKLPVAAYTSQYLVTPTIPIGKLITVYAASQMQKKYREEVQLLVQPFDGTQEAPQDGTQEAPQ
jgi:hypothetical protein